MNYFNSYVISEFEAEINGVSYFDEEKYNKVNLITNEINKILEDIDYNKADYIRKNILNRDEISDIEYFIGNHSCNFNLQNLIWNTIVQYELKDYTVKDIIGMDKINIDLIMKYIDIIKYINYNKPLNNHFNPTIYRGDSGKEYDLKTILD